MAVGIKGKMPRRVVMQTLRELEKKKSFFFFFLFLKRRATLPH